MGHETRDGTNRCEGLTSLLYALDDLTLAPNYDLGDRYYL